MNELEKYGIHLNANNEVMNWIKTTGKKAIEEKKINVSNMEHIIDFLVSSSAPNRLQKMSFADAKRKSEEWSKANQKKGKDLKDSYDDIETIHDFMDGTKIVRLKTKKSFLREGFLMSACQGGYDPNSAEYSLYSYRDAKNMPHATFEVRKNNNEIVQIKGKSNGPIHPKYINHILSFLKSIGINIRPNDMKNLGYYHIHKKHLEYLKKSEAWSMVSIINGEAYGR